MGIVGDARMGELLEVTQHAEGREQGVVAGVVVEAEDDRAV